ncbi:MAG: hypothetical protein AAGE18_06940 [Pseudomonadota bacterium]
MPTKTERILDLYPRTFRAGGARSPLGVLTETFGTELQLGENALAAVMRAHWVDQADRGAEKIDDLIRFAALYGLAPRPDDGIEEFRARLKTWVALILDGPANVENLLRASAAILGIEVETEEGGFDPWWTRSDPLLLTAEPDGRDATSLIFGNAPRASVGRDASRATIVGRVDLGDTVDLTGGAILHLSVDGAAALTIDLAAGAVDPAAVEREAIVEAINTAAGEIADLAGNRLRLTSPSAGVASALTIGEGADDAAPAPLGLPTRALAGTEARAAVYESPIDLSAGADLSTLHYVRLDIDGTLAEIDVADGSPGTVGLDAIRDTINAAFGATVAAHDGTRLTLTSPSSGGASRILFQQPAAQDATAVLFGVVPTAVVGADAAPATLTGAVDLSAGVDLSGASLLVLARDGQPEVTVDCRGVEPSATQLPELVTLINDAAGAGTARQDGRHLILSGADIGPAGALIIGFAGADDASEILLGLPPRSAEGADAVPARLTGEPVLGDPVNLWGADRISLSLDHAPAVTIELAAGAADRAAVTAAEIAGAINASVGATVASVSADALVLESQRTGAQGALALLPLKRQQARRHVSRLAIREDAAVRVLGVSSARADGQAATAARIAGSRDLTRGADLRTARHLRLSVDDGPAFDIDCAGPRPRATTLDEVVERINAATAAEVALAEAGRLLLHSPTTGGASRLALSTPRAADAASLLLGVEEADVRGAAASRPSFLGLVDLSAGVDLSSASHLRLAVDGGPEVEIDCGGPDPAATRPAEIAIRINVAMGVNVASHDGARLILTTPSAGVGATLDILAPALSDATTAILGIAPGRSYVGADAVAAMVTGQGTLNGPQDLSTTRFLRIGIDRADPVEVDCAAEADDPTAVAPEDIVAAIDAILEAEVAAIVDDRLTLTSPTTGLASRIVIAPTSSGDAAEVLLGEAPREATGADAAPAEIVGTVDLASGVDLSDRGVLPIVTSLGRIEVPLAGEVSDGTSAEEIVASINASGAAVASLTAETTLRIAAPEVAPTLLEIPAFRSFELEEYIPARQEVAQEARHGDRVHLAGSAGLEIGFTADLGTDAPGLIDIVQGWEVRYLAPLGGGERVTLRDDGAGGIAGSLEVGGDEQPVPPSAILAAPLVPLLRSGETAPRRAAPGADGRRQIALEDVGAPERVVLRQRGGARGDLVVLTPAADVPPGASDLLTGRLARDGTDWVLQEEGATTARLAGPVARPGLEGQVVAVHGTVAEDAEPPVVSPTRIFPAFDLRITREAGVEELVLPGILLADPIAGGHLSLEQQLAALPDPPMRAETRLAAEALAGGSASDWIFAEADSSRFDADDFGTARYAGPPRFGRGLFDATRFAEQPRAAVTPTFAGEEPPSAHSTLVTLGGEVAAGGTARINLPRDLPRRFGARFDDDRFALADDAPITLPGVVFEPTTDPDFAADRITGEPALAQLLSAARVDIVPIGFAPVSAPFFTPVRLTGGRPDQAAQLFLDAPGLTGFFRLFAVAPGTFGNDIAVVVCDASPGRYDLLVSFAGARFENARALVAGPDLSGTTAELLTSAPRGVQHLKAGGIRIEVTRDARPEGTQDS